MHGDDVIGEHGGDALGDAVVVRLEGLAELLDGRLVARGRPVLKLGGQEAVALDVAQLELEPEIAAEHDEGARVSTSLRSSRGSGSHRPLSQAVASALERGTPWRSWLKMNKAEPEKRPSGPTPS